MMDVPDIKSLVYSISLQARQIAATNHHFKSPASISWLLLQGHNFPKKNMFSQSEISDEPQANTQKGTQRNFATRKRLQNFEGHDC